MYRSSGRPKHSCKACCARMVGQYYLQNVPARLQNSQRSRLRSAQLAQGVRPFPKLWWYVGCTPQFLVSYVEAMLPPEWNWENHGKLWQLDHIRPLSEGDLSCPFELYRLAHYTNLQPPSTRENIAKGPRPHRARSLLGSRETDGVLHTPARTQRIPHVDFPGAGKPIVPAQRLGPEVPQDRVRGRREARGAR